ncbi:MAG: aminotransferase class V-fold PLP-dependent enzyme [Luteitalea sp.]|nr:aminotransferase class V-fold PLP-dependent enzyme [Luteitalea sp.]
MTDISQALPGFGDFDGRTWLNTAHQGALPLVAADAARDAISWKVAPFELTTERFSGVPARLRAVLGRLLDVPSDEVILGNSASYGLHLVASAFPWQEGDEVLVMEGDFPSDILPWLLMERRHGVKVVRIRPRGRVVEPDELAAAITSRTRVFCTTWVHSFSGFAVDLDALGTICREHGVSFVINGSQALGARSFNLTEAPVDAFTCVGHKWLCGPYGTGFAWLRPEFRDRLHPIKAYWLSMQTAEDLGKELVEVELREGLGARAYDVFGTANFLNFVPFTAAVQHIVDLGLERIRVHDQALVTRFIEGLDKDHFMITSPTEPGPRRSTLIFFSHRDAGRNQQVYAALSRQGIHFAFRAGSLRLSPHLYNTSIDIERALDVLTRER